MARTPCRVHMPSGDLCGRAGVDNWMVKVPGGTGDLPVCGLHAASFAKLVGDCDDACIRGERACNDLACQRPRVKQEDSR